jgi:hypothetical protein
VRFSDAVHPFLPKSHLSRLALSVLRLTNVCDLHERFFHMTDRLTEHVRGFSLTTCFLLLVFGCLIGATNTAHAQARGYVTDTCNNTVSVIDMTTNSVVDSNGGRSCLWRRSDP